MIRSLAARSLSARQKSSIRNMAYSLGGYTRRPVEVLVEDLVLLDGARTFLQIGANEVISPTRSTSPSSVTVWQARLSNRSRIIFVSCKRPTAIFPAWLSCNMPLPPRTAP